jgi:L,D-transpeptidase ErfK/SrfK
MVEAPADRALWRRCPGGMRPRQGRPSTAGRTHAGREERVLTRHEDTLYDIARRSDWARRTDPGQSGRRSWLRANRAPTRPTDAAPPRDGIVVNLPSTVFTTTPARAAAAGHYTYPVSIKDGLAYPLSRASIVRSAKSQLGAARVCSPGAPCQRRPAASCRSPPGPNPLGLYAMRLGLGSYRSGTNNPLAVGMAVTRSCIRMYPRDEELSPWFPWAQRST